MNDLDSADWQQMSRVLQPYWEKVDAVYALATGEKHKDAILSETYHALLRNQRALSCQGCHPVTEIYTVQPEIQRSLTGLVCSRHQDDFIGQAAAHGFHLISLSGKPGRFYRRVPPGQPGILPGRYSLKEIGELLQRHRFQPEVVNFLATVLQQ